MEDFNDHGDGDHVEVRNGDYEHIPDEVELFVDTDYENDLFYFDNSDDQDAEQYQYRRHSRKIRQQIEKMIQASWS